MDASLTAQCLFPQFIELTQKPKNVFVFLWTILHVGIRLHERVLKSKVYTMWIQTIQVQALRNIIHLIRLATSDKLHLTILLQFSLSVISHSIILYLLKKKTRITFLTVIRPLGVNSRIKFVHFFLVVMKKFFHGEFFWILFPYILFCKTVSTFCLGYTLQYHF